MTDKEKQIRLRDVQDVLELLGDRWRGAILASLCHDSKRFNELKKDLGNITPRILIKELRYLEMNLIVQREENTLSEKSVIYSLTKHGKTLKPLIESIHFWATKHRNLIVRR